MADSADRDRKEPDKDQVSEALWNLYRAITSPYNTDWDLPTERARYVLIQLGYDPDTWGPPPRP